MSLGIPMAQVWKKSFFFLRRPLGRYIELGKNWREMLQPGYLKSAVLETTVGVKFPIVR